MLSYRALQRLPILHIRVNNFYMYIIEIPIPSLEESWLFKPITTAIQKDISQIILQDNAELLYEFLTELIQMCVENKHKQNIYKLSMLDKFIILLKLRCVSIGQSIDLNLTEEDKLYKIVHSCSYTLQQAIQALKTISSLTIKHDIIEIICNIPLICFEKYIYKTINSETDISIDSLYIYFIRNIKINNRCIEFKDLAIEDQRQIINQLPSSTLSKVHIYIHNIINSIKNIVLYKTHNFTLRFNIFSMIYFDYIKLIFQEDLFKIYYDIYILNKTINMSSEYIENITPIERDLYISIYKRENKTAQTNDQDIPIQQREDNSLSDLDIYKNIKGG